MRFWDASALLSLLAEQQGGPEVGALSHEDPETMIWWGTPVELVAGACRLRRTGETDESGLMLLLAKIEDIRSEVDQIAPTEQVRRAASRIARLHDLRAADALQLAAALIWTEHNTHGVGFVCLDKRLREAAQREGFTVMPV